VVFRAPGSPCGVRLQPDGIDVVDELDGLCHDDRLRPVPQGR
jgi:hypothetical protein